MPLLLVVSEGEKLYIALLKNLEPREDILYYKAVGPAGQVLDGPLLVSLKPHPWIHSTGCITSPARGSGAVDPRVWL